jgi:uncharacterized protein YxjI
MKRFILRDKLFSLGGDLTITDEHGIQVLYVDGKVLSLGRRLELRDQKNETVATIQQRIVALRPTYDIHLPGNVNVNISERFSLIGDKLKIDVPGNNDLEVHGNLVHHEYDIDRHGKRVARVTRAWISLVDSYGVEVNDDEDALLVLCCAVVIDELLDKERKERD